MQGIPRAGAQRFAAPRPRGQGARRRLTDAVVERAIQLRKELPARTTRTLIDIMRREGTLATELSFHRATLDRHLDRRGASRRRMHVQGTKRTIKMRFEHFGDLWVGDYHHGPLIRLPNGRTTTAKLGAFIDHCTRYPVADRYYAAEDISTLRDTLLRALLRWGPPKKIYVDRGAVYRSRQLAAALHAIKTILVHSRPYYSQGRGVIEKWWQIISPFEAEVATREELLTLHELNTFWEAYREERYCHNVHSELGRAPAEAVASVERRSIDPSVLGTLFMISEDRRVHRKDSCVSVLGHRFLCESFLRGRKVKVRFDPNDLSFVEIFLDGERVQRALPQPINATPEPHPEPEQVTQSIDYLALIRRDYDRSFGAHQN